MPGLIDRFRSDAARPSRSAKLLAAGALLLAVSSLSVDLISKYNERVARRQVDLMANAGHPSAFGIYGDYGDHRQWKRLMLVPLTLVGYFSIRRLGRNWLAVTSYGLSLLAFLHWASEAIAIFTVDWKLYANKSHFELLNLAANPLDYLVLLSVLGLFLITAIRPFPRYSA